GRGRVVGERGWAWVKRGGGASVSMFVGVKKLTKGVPFARAPAAARSIAGRFSASASSIGSMNDIASVEPAASDATRRSVAAIASRVRYMLTPVDATPAGRAAA